VIPPFFFPFPFFFFPHSPGSLVSGGEGHQHGDKRQHAPCLFFLSLPPPFFFSFIRKRKVMEFRTWAGSCPLSFFFFPFLFLYNPFLLLAGQAGDSIAWNHGIFFPGSLRFSPDIPLRGDQPIES